MTDYSAFHDTLRYEKWDGSQEAKWDADALFDAMTADLLRDGDVDLALQRAFRWGFDQEGGPGEGLRDLLERMLREKQQLLDDYDFGSVFDDVDRRLTEIIDQERATIRQRTNTAESEAAVDRAASRFLDRRLTRLEELPTSTPDRIEVLRTYEFVDNDASEKFQILLAELQQSIAESMFNNLMGKGGAPNESDLGEMTQFLSDINEAFDQHAAGQQPDLDRLNNRWADRFGGRVESMEHLRHQLQARQAATQALLDLLTPEQRRDVLKMMSDAMRNAGIEEEISALQHHLGPPPQDGMAQSSDHRQHELSLEMAMQVLEQAGKIDQLEDELRGVGDIHDLKGIDPQLLEDVLSEQDQDWVARWSDVASTLAEAGLVTETRHGLELTPQAIRKIGMHALGDIFSSLKTIGLGDHDVHHQGKAGELGETSSPWQFGDPFVLDLAGTVRNGIAASGPGTPVKLTPDSFQVIDREARTSTATILLIDMSRSMLNNGCWDAAKRTALALDTLIRTKYPRDVLELIGFSATAHWLTMKDLPKLEWNQYNYGTNLQQALELSRKRLRSERGRTRQVIVITDGEPTAHIEDGEVRFNYPPTRETFEATLREVVRCTREGIVINTFLLERTPYMEAFVADLMRINRGRVINSSPTRLGSYVLKDFLSNRTKDRMDD